MLDGSTSKRIVIVATKRYAINFNDFYMLFRRSRHEVVAVVYEKSIEAYSWWRYNRYWAKDGVAGPAREELFDPIDKTACQWLAWETPEQLLETVGSLNADIICMGNGRAPEHKMIVDRFGMDKCLFSEYGWLPWSKHFYISRLGCGDVSEIANVDEIQLGKQSLRHDEIESLRSDYGRGFGLRRKDYVYVPLQKDVDDFKFTLTDFKSNDEFIEFIHEVVPRDVHIYLKCHPLYKKDYKLRRFGRFTDITNSRWLSKRKIYQNMLAMIVINSTSVLEAMMFHGRVFAYGRDLFLNKGIVHFDVRDPGQFSACLSEPVRTDLQDAFVSLLLERQVERRRCIANDRAYIDNHYWTNHL